MSSLWTKLCADQDRKLANPAAYSVKHAEELETTMKEFRATFWGIGQESPMPELTEEEQEESYAIESIEREETSTNVERINRNVEENRMA